MATWKLDRKKTRQATKIGIPITGYHKPYNKRVVGSITPYIDLNNHSFLHCSSKFIRMERSNTSTKKKHFWQIWVDNVPRTSRLVGYGCDSSLEGHLWSPTFWHWGFFCWNSLWSEAWIRTNPAWKKTLQINSQQIRSTKTSLQNVGTAIELEMIDYPQQIIRIQWEISPNL